MQEVDILGTKYKIEYRTKNTDAQLSTLYGYCNYGKGLIVVNKDYEKRIQQITARHEILHAFLFESGLSTSTLDYEGAWATNEEMVDWVATMWPKINRVYKELKVL